MKPNQSSTPNPNEPFPAEPLIDSLLSEWLGETSPPDLTRRSEAIVAAARALHRSDALFTEEELLVSANLAWHETQFDAVTLPTQFADANAPARPSPRIQKSQPAVRLRETQTATSGVSPRWIALALAAGVTGIVISVPFWYPKSDSGTETVARVDSKPSRAFPKLGSGRDGLFPEVTTTPSAAPTDPVAPAATETESLAEASPALANNTPEARVDTSRIANAPESASRPRTTLQTLGASRDLETISVINDQLHHLWNRLEISAGKSAGSNVLEDRLAQLLLGRLPTSTERESVRKSTSQPAESAKVLVHRWIEGEEFERHWADVLTEYYLDVAPGSQDERATKFADWLRQSIRENLSIGEIERQLMAATATKDQPSAYWQEHWLEVGNQAPNRLLATNSQKAIGLESHQLSALETLSLQALRLSGQSVATCSQCHQSIDSQTIPHPGLSIAGVQPESIFGTAAVFATAVDANKKDFYASDSEGKVSLVAPTLPDGKPIAGESDRRLEWGQWIASNARARRPMVDFVWYKLVGQPLMPKVGLSPDEGLDERRDLLEYLADRAQKESVSIRQVVYWVAMSDPLYLEQPRVETNEFLKWSDDDLLAFQKQRRTFARYAGIERAGVSRGRLDSLARWLGPNASTANNNGLLAQPSSVNGTGEVKAAVPSSLPNSLEANWGAEHVAYEISTSHPYHRILEYANAFAASPIEWSTVVEHSYLVAFSRYPSAEERKRADELLAWSNGDRKLASQRLLNALLGQL